MARLNPALASENLESELRDAVERVVIGERQGPGLAGAATRAARAVLLRHGQGRAQIEARAEGATVSLLVLLPVAPTGVRTLVLRLQ